MIILLATGRGSSLDAGGEGGIDAPAYSILNPVILKLGIMEPRSQGNGPAEEPDPRFTRLQPRP